MAAQRALAAHDWPEGVDLRVRIGVHTGEATPAGDQYVGLAVHRAARICDAGHGGQILVSETTRSLLEDEEAELDGLELRDLGHHLLKDFDRPVRIYQLAIHGLPAEFPALRTRQAKVRHSSPTARTSSRPPDQRSRPQAEPCGY